MKGFVVTLGLLCMSFMMNAVNLVKGSLNPLKGEKVLEVSLDCSKTMYKKTRPFSDFLKKAKRVDNWEEESLKYFIENFNDRTKESVGLQAVSSASNNKQGNYKMILKPLTINGGGAIKAEALVVDKRSNKTIATIEFAESGDDDDRITLRDPMRDAGRDFGRFFRKSLK